jgi:hypothetical protein
MKEIELVDKRTTAMYRSPELGDIEGLAMFGSAVLTEAVDIWALGCVLYNMAFFKPPFPPDGLRTSRYTIPTPHKYSKDVIALIKRMLHEDVDMRANIDEVIACVDAILSNEPLPATHHHHHLSPPVNITQETKKTQQGTKLPQKNTDNNNNTNVLAADLFFRDDSAASSVTTTPIAPVITPGAVAPLETFADFANFSHTCSIQDHQTQRLPEQQNATSATSRANLGGSNDMWVPIMSNPMNNVHQPPPPPSSSSSNIVSSAMFFEGSPAPANKVIDAFGFLVSPTSHTIQSPPIASTNMFGGSPSLKHTQARDAAFDAFEGLNQERQQQQQQPNLPSSPPPSLPSSNMQRMQQPSSCSMPLSPMGMHNMLSPPSQTMMHTSATPMMMMQPPPGSHLPSSPNHLQYPSSYNTTAGPPVHPNNKNQAPYPTMTSPSSSSSANAASNWKSTYDFRF